MSKTNRINHLAFAIRPENFDVAIEHFSLVFGTAFYGPVDRADQGVRVAISWDAGIELQTPLDEANDSPVARSLRERGEGLVGFVFRVRDLESTLDRLGAYGYSPVAKVDGLAGGAPWYDRFTVLEEAFFTDFFGTTFALAQVEER